MDQDNIWGNKNHLSWAYMLLFQPPHFSAPLFSKTVYTHCIHGLCPHPLLNSFQSGSHFLILSKMLLSRSLMTFLLPNPKVNSRSSSYLSFTPSFLENTCFPWCPHGPSLLTVLYFPGHEPAVNLLAWLLILSMAFRHQRAPRLCPAPLLFLYMSPLSGWSHPVSYLYVIPELIISKFYVQPQTPELQTALSYCLPDASTWMSNRHQKNLPSPKASSWSSTL